MTGLLSCSARRRRTDTQPVMLIVVRAARDGWSVDALCDSGAGPEAIERRLTGALRPLEPGDYGTAAGRIGGENGDA